MKIVIDTDGHCYIPSRLFPPPFLVDVFIDGEPHITAIQAVFQYPQLGLPIMIGCNNAVRDADNDLRPSEAVNREWVLASKSKEDSKEN